MFAHRLVPIRRSFALAAVTFAATAASAPLNGQSAYHLPIEEHVFDNGLRLLVLEREGESRVVCRIFTDMGSIHEIPGQLGAAHFLEHLMFKGTPTLGTTDWEAERQIRDRITETEAALLAEKDRARNEIRQRGIMDDYRHAASTPEMDRLRAELARLEDQAEPYRRYAAMKGWYQAFGGSNLSATTEQEYMKFDIELPVERVDLFLRVEADRMTNTVFREFDEERMVLVEQRIGDLNNPSTPYYEQMSAMVGVVHPMFWPEGYMSDFGEYSREYERYLYETYFVPNNTTLVFIGGLSLEEMIPRVEHYFGWMERMPEPTRTPAIEPPPAAERRLVYRNDQIQPRVEVRYQIPGVGHPDRPTFDVLGEVAAGVITEALTQAAIAGTVNVNTRVVHTSRFGVPGSINFEVILEDESQLATAESTLLTAVESLKAAPRVEQVTHAQKVLRTAWHRTARDANALAFEVGHFQTMDRWQTLPVYLQARDDTTPDDIARIADMYFVPNNRSVGVARSTAEGGRPATEDQP